MMLPANVVAFQKSFAEKHPEFIQAAHTLAGRCNEVFADSSGLPFNEQQIVCRCLAQTVANSFLAMNLLISHGFGADAHKIARSMFETSVVLAAFDHFPELVQDFIDFRWLKKMKMIEQAKGTSREAFISPEDESEIKANYDRVLPRFSDKKGRPLSSWYRGSFADICKKLDEASVKMPWAVAHYSDLYRTASGLIHGDIMGVESQVDTTGYNVAIPPSDQYISESLISAHWAMAIALASYASIAKLCKAQDYGDQLIDEWAKIWGEGSREFDEAKKESEAALTKGQ